MEKFNPDEKMLVLMKLPPHEVLVVCETSKEMNSSCRNTKYSLMWQNKIKQDFNVNSKGSYEKYKFLKQLYEELKKIDEDILISIDDSVADFNDEFKGGHIRSMPEAKGRIRAYIKELDEEFDLRDKKEVVKNLIINKVLVDNETRELLRK